MYRHGARRAATAIDVANLRIMIMIQGGAAVGDAMDDCFRRYVTNEREAITNSQKQSFFTL